MDEEDPVLSHQIQAVSELNKSFEKVSVLTGKIGKYVKTDGVEVYSSGWVQDKKIQNIIYFYFTFFKVLFREKPDAVFSHMTDVQSFLIFPILKLLRLKHYLWYAHKTYSPWLRLTLPWLTGVFTSTPGSFPLKIEKLYPVGQAIRHQDFPMRSFNNDYSFNKLIHVGRFDSAKNIHLLIEAASQFKINFPNLILTLIGSPSNKFENLYAEKIKFDYSDFETNKSLFFFEKITRENVSQMLLDNEIFIHAYKGSLDKTLLEATLSGLPVVTLNPEYMSIFGSWSKSKKVDVNFLVDEMTFLTTLSKKDLLSELAARRELIKSHHSLENWGSSIAKIINYGENPAELTL